MDVVIPGYEIVKEIGKGGMATVYVAVQNSFDRQVALKIMARHLTGDDVFSERFFREARIIASLNHRNIVPVFDVGRAGDHHYLSMEYLPGGDLKQRLKQGMRADEALHVIYEIAMALSYAHSKSYIHRDIKPENILFREDNTVVLTDFGIAKALDTSDCNMTSTGMIVGSPHYMSPEQALARDIDTRSD
ncbi:MAG TPA: serine/threonine protein kinase, partial [Gammaproteobacteria bacterium]|nr:serine/threonine protein kinase [Gammaproteobacteria bacterium]